MLKQPYGYVYMVRNKINGKLYFGITVNDFQTRYYGNILKYTHNEHLKNSIEAYGIENFEINEQFDVAYNEDDLWDLEDMYICLYDTIKNGYNVRRSGSKHKGRGHFEHTNETKQKMKESANVAVVCLNTRKIFDNMLDAVYWVDGRTDKTGTGSISLCCTNDIKSAYKHPLTGEKLAWAYYKDYINMTQEEIGQKLTIATRDVFYSAIHMDLSHVEDKNTYKNTNELDKETLEALDQQLSFLSPIQLHIFKEIILQDKPLEVVGKQIGRSKESVGRTCKEVIKKIQQRFTVQQFKEILY